MMTFLLVIHVIVCLVLIAVVLLQAGRGGGFSEMVGGGQPQSIFGTQTNTFMTRATEVCAVLFIITSLTLGILTSQKSKSLVTKELQANPVSAFAAKTPKDAQTGEAITKAKVAAAASKVEEAVAEKVAENAVVVTEKPAEALPAKAETP